MLKLKHFSLGSCVIILFWSKRRPRASVSEVNHATVWLEAQIGGKKEAPWHQRLQHTLQPFSFMTLHQHDTLSMSLVLTKYWYLYMFFYSSTTNDTQLHLSVNGFSFVLSFFSVYIVSAVVFVCVWIQYSRKSRSILSTAQAVPALIQITSPVHIFLVCAIENLPYEHGGTATACCRLATPVSPRG